MTATHTPLGPSPGHSLPAAIADTVTALSMTVGRGRTARFVADLAALGACDRVVDVGCGPGTAVREARRRGAAQVTGVDPSPQALRLARALTAAGGRGSGIAFVEGTAEHLPLPDAGADVLWSLSAVHHWQDQEGGLAEARRVLAPGGRLLLVERLTAPGARGHARHGLTEEQARALVGAVARAAFADVIIQMHKAGRRTLVVVTGTAPSSS